jgi:hypothetical protein
VPVWSEWVIAETWRTLAWRWLHRSAQPDEFEWASLSRSANEMLRHLLPVMRFVSLRNYAGPEAWSELADPDDLPVWQTATLANAAFVVSQNVRHFPPLVDGRHRHGSVEYVTAIEFIEDVLGADAAAEYDHPLPGAAHLRSRRSPG